MPTIKAYSAKHKRTDIVLDVYHPSSLKRETRSKRRRGVRRRMTSTGKLPSNWRNFLRDSDNKTKIFHFLADKIAQMSAKNMIIVTKEEAANSNHPISLAKMAPCSHEEADTQAGSRGGLHAHGVSQYFVNQKHKVLLTGDGSRKVICGRSCGLISHLL